MNIDKQIAEKVMGWKYFSHQDYACDTGAILPFVSDDCGERSLCVFTQVSPYESSKFNPSINIADAWLVVEKMRELGYSINIEAQQKGKWRCNIILIGNEWTTRIETADEDAAPMAICLAALSALEVKGE